MLVSQILRSKGDTVFTVTPSDTVAAVAGVHAARDRVAVAHPAQHEVVEERGDRGRSSLDRRRRQSGLAVDGPDHVPATAGGALFLDEGEHVVDARLPGRLGHHGEEDLQVAGLRGQRCSGALLPR